MSVNKREVQRAKEIIVDVLIYLKERQDEFIQELAVKQAILQVKKNDLQREKSGLSTYISERDRVKDDEQSINEKMGQFDRDIDNVKKSIDELIASIASLEKELSGVFVLLFSRKKELKGQIESAERSLNQEKNKLDKLVSDRSILERERKVGLLESLESRVVEKENLVALLESEVTGVEQDIEKINGELSEIESAIRIHKEAKKDEEIQARQVTKVEKGDFEETGDVIVDEKNCHENEAKTEPLSLYGAILLLRSEEECLNCYFT